MSIEYLRLGKITSHRRFFHKLNGKIFLGYESIFDKFWFFTSMNSRQCCVNTLQYTCLAGCRLLDMFWDNELIFLIYIPRNIRMLSDPSGGFSSPPPPPKKENFDLPDNHFMWNKRYELFYSKGKKINSICILRNIRMV